MRGVELRLNQTQSIRLQIALQSIEKLYSETISKPVVTVADSIPIQQEDSILKGHGTMEREGELVATLCGVVERVNKLVYVRTLRTRYKPEVGDIVVGRVLEVAQKRWKLDINYGQDAVLMLSSMNLPDGIQRRRTAVDELNMRSVFEENDVVCAEVRNFHHDGSLQLQARSQKYGKVGGGQLIRCPSYLVKRQKQHFHEMEEDGVDLILGCNGFVWVGEHAAKEENEGMQPATRQQICRIANAVRVLSALGFSFTLDVIMNTVALSHSLNLPIDQMLAPHFYVSVAEGEADRRTKKK